MRHQPRNFLTTLLVGLCLTLSSQAQQKVEPPLITVTGDAEVSVAPDEVVFDVTVQSFNRELRLAKSQTDERLKNLLELTRRYKVAAADVQTDYVKLEPRYKRGDETRTLTGYSIRKDLVFTLRDITQAESLLSEVTESGVTRINSIKFQSSQMRKYRDQARALAIKAAREKAVAMTAEIGQVIGKAYSIEEEALSPNRAYPAQNYMANISTTSGDDSSESEGTLAIGQIKVNARVTVRFILE